MSRVSFLPSCLPAFLPSFQMILSILSLPLLFFALNASSPTFRMTPVVVDATANLATSPFYQDYLAPGFSSTVSYKFEPPPSGRGRNLILGGTVAFVNDTFTKWTAFVPSVPPHPTPVPPTSLSPDQLQRALWNAASNGNATRTEELLLAGADPTLSFQGRTILEITAQNSLYNRFYDLIGVPNPWVPVLETLLEYGADPAQKNEEGLTPYEHYAPLVVWYPHPDIKRLLSVRLPKRGSLQDQLWKAVRNGNTDLAEEVLVEGADPTQLYRGRTFLEIAAQNTLYHRFYDLIGVPNPWVPVIETLIRHGANPAQKNVEGRTPFEHYLQYVAWYPNPAVARLLNPPPRSHSKLQNLLRFAVCAGDPARVEMWIELGADPRERSYGRTFLELAAHNSHKYEGDWREVLRVLLKHGADPNQLDDQGLTAREQYERLPHPHSEIAELLGA